MRNACMIAHQVHQPSLLNIRLLTEFQNLQTNNTNLDQRIAHFFLYTKASVYQGQLKKVDINIQLAWNEKCISALTDSLSGKRNKIDIRFCEQIESTKPTQMSLICEIQTAINIRIFQISMFKIPSISPINHMRTVFMNFKDRYSEQEKKLKLQKQKIQQEIKEISALQKQIEEQTITQVAHLKKNFIDVINACKKQLRKHMKTGISEIINEEEEIVEEEASKRRIVRVNRQKLQSQARGNEQLKNEKGGQFQNEYMDMLFDS